MIFNKRAQDLVQGLRPEKKLNLMNKNGTSDLYLYDYFGTGGIEPAAVVKELQNAKGNNLNIHLLSEGGDVFAAKGVFNAIKSFNGKKTCYVDGLAASAATFVMMAADKIVSAPNSTFMTHPVWTATIGNSEDMRKMADQLDMETNTIAAIYAQKMGKPVEDIMSMLHGENWFDAKQALGMNFIDEVQEPMNNKIEEKSEKALTKLTVIEAARMRSQLTAASRASASQRLSSKTNPNSDK